MNSGAPAQDPTEATPKKKGPSQAEKLLQLVDDVEFFHDHHGTAYATFTVADHRETAALRHRGFRSYLERRFYEFEGKPAGSQAVQDALGVMDGEARFAGAEHPVHVRVAGDDEAIYLDLGNPEWSAVEVTPSGWQVVANPPVKFRRPKAMAALPNPATDGDIRPLRALVNVTDHDWPLLLGWVIGALRPAGPYPVLASYGEQGSAKSTTQRITRTMFDPSSAALRSAPRNEHELVITAKNSYVLGFDNASMIPPWLSDAFARIATGAGFAARELYSDSEEMIFEEKRPVLINGIEEVVNRPDLLDRALILEHPRIPSADRTTESDVWAAVTAAHPRILAGILDALSAALRNLPSVELSQLPRMADFCKWVVASESSLGWEPGRFYDTYADNRESAHEVAIDSSPIAALIRTMAEQGFTGTASELLAELEAVADDPITRIRSWPKSPRALSGALRRLAPNLREIGVLIEFERIGSHRTITVKRETRSEPYSSVASVICVTNGSVSSDANDGDDANDAKFPTHSNGELTLEDALLDYPAQAEPTPAFCSKPGHRSSDWLADDNRLVCGICHPRTVALVDPAVAEQIRASVDGEWLDVGEPTGPVWDFTAEPA